MNLGNDHINPDSKEMFLIDFSLMIVHFLMFKLVCKSGYNQEPLNTE